MALALMPKLQVVLKEALVAQTPIQALWQGAPAIFFDNLPAAPVWPLWVLIVVDQIPDGPWCHRCRVQVDMYGKDNTLDWRDKMKDHFRTLESVVRDLDGDWPANCGWSPWIGACHNQMRQAEPGRSST